MTRRGALLAAAIVVAAGAVLLAFQPVRSDWWTGGDADSVYLSGGLSLMGGKLTKYYDHPGMPLQELLAATFEARWAVAGDGARAEQSAAWFRDLDRTRWVFRGWALVLYFGSALTLAWITGSAFRDWRAAAAGGLLFLAAPQVALYAIEFRPDVVIGALSALVVALLVTASRRRSALHYLGAAALIGFTVTVKLHAIGLIAPLAVALLLGRPAASWAGPAWTSARAWIARHRRGLGAGAGVWATLVVLLNIGSAGGPPSKAAAFAVAAAVLIGVCAAVVRFTRGVLGLGAAMVVAALAGFVVPNLFYAGTIPTMSRWVAAALLGRGVNSDASPLQYGLGPLKAWAPFAVLAVVGLVRAVRAGEREAWIWATGAAAMGALAAARFATPHYFIPAIALTIPLIVRAVQLPGRLGTPLLAVTVLVLIFVPYRDGVRDGRNVAANEHMSHRLVGWARAHLDAKGAVLSTVMDADRTYQAYIDVYATDPPPRAERVFDANVGGVATARAHGLKPQYVVAPGARLDPASIGARSLTPAPGAPHGVYAVR